MSTMTARSTAAVICSSVSSMPQLAISVANCTKPGHHHASLHCSFIVSGSLTE